MKKKTKNKRPKHPALLKASEAADIAEKSLPAARIRRAKEEVARNQADARAAGASIAALLGGVYDSACDGKTSLTFDVHEDKGLADLRVRRIATAALRGMGYRVHVRDQDIMMLLGIIRWDRRPANPVKAAFWRLRNMLREDL